MKFHLTIARKLLGLSILAVAFLAAVGVAGLVARHYLTVGADRVLAAQEALRFQMKADQAHDALRADVLAAILSSAERDPAEVKALREELAEHRQELTGSLQTLQGLPLDRQTRAALDKVRPALESYVRDATGIAELAFSNRAGAQAQLGEFGASFKRLEREMAALSDLIEKNAHNAETESRATSELAGQLVAVGIVIAALLLLAISWGISRSIVRRIGQAVEVAETVARGDLRSSFAVEGSDEAARLLQSLSRMNGNLLDLVGTVRQATENIASGTTQIASGNQDLSQRTEEQASNLQQTAASMEQISATVRANADMTRRASDMAATASASAAASGQAVETLVVTMGEITASSRRITDIIGVIDGIAFQTNILALNAAVEAARAGDQGRGFAVVAAEVRTLAQRSATAAKEIKALIEASVSKVSQGEAQAARAGVSMGDVVQEVREVTSLLGEISAATLEQNKGVEEVSVAVTHIDHVTQSNASLVEEAAAAAESLNRQAHRLVEAVARFRTEGSGPLLLPA